MTEYVMIDYECVPPEIDPDGRYFSKPDYFFRDFLAPVAYAFQMNKDYSFVMALLKIARTEKLFSTGLWLLPNGPTLRKLTYQTTAKIIKAYDTTSYFTTLGFVPYPRLFPYVFEGDSEMAPLHLINVSDTKPDLRRNILNLITLDALSS
jgi:hypothetical protein